MSAASVVSVARTVGAWTILSAMTLSFSSVFDRLARIANRKLAAEQILSRGLFTGTRSSYPSRRGTRRESLAPMPYRFQLQMPPDLQGQTWIRVSKA